MFVLFPPDPFRAEGKKAALFSPQQLPQPLYSINQPL
jgi:hypothetical protein